MSEFKGTPGPWVIQYGSTNKDRPYAMYGENRRPVLNWSSFSRPADIEAQANARLIAAAPDLLEALTKLLGIAIQLDNAGDGWTEITADTQDVQQARAVIAKAQP